MKKRKKKKHGEKWEKIFVICNIIIIVIIICIYLYRLIYFYKDMNTIKDDNKLITTLLSSNNITYTGSGLYKTNNSYIYKGKDVNNYLLFSGRIFRIIGIDDIGIKLITDESESSLVYGIDSNYSESYIYNWLNNDVFINTIDKDKIISTNWCNQGIDINKYECNENISNYVGLLSIEDYQNALGSSSYLNNESYYWTINTSLENKAYYIYDNGKISNDIKSETGYYSYGIRPVIYIRKDNILYSGNGTKDNPYVIEDNLSSYKIGSYIKYNNYIFRIMDINNDTIKLIMNGYISNDISKEYVDVIKYLNNEFIKNFNTNELVKMDYNINNYNINNLYNYKDTTNKSSNYIIIPKVGDIFATGYNSWLGTYLDTDNDLIYTSLENGALYGDLSTNKNKIRPIITIKSDLTINGGNGTKNNPLLVGDNE